MLKLRVPSKRGAAEGVVILGIIATFAFAFSQIASRLSKALFQNRKLRAYSYTTFSGAETMLFSYRLAQIQYIKEISNQNCTAAKPFIRALKEGSGCPDAITVFSESDASDYSNLPFSYLANSGGCVISTSFSSCGRGAKNLVVAPVIGGDRTQIPDPSNPNSVPGYIFSLQNIDIDKGILEFNASYTSSGDNNRLSTQRYAFAIRGFLPNAAHLEGDGRVTQETPDPLSKCPGSAWATFLVFNPSNQKCEQFSQLGSGTGLAFYNHRFFGFRPFDGQVVDMLAANSDSSYMVDENGNVENNSVFIPYKKSALINVDDITVIPTQNAETETTPASLGGQVYYVAGQGSSANIGVLLSNGDRKIVCDLGGQGWGQGYEGIASLSFSDPLIQTTGDGMTGSRLAVFFLKTSGGDYLTASVLKIPSSPVFICHVAKENNLQQIEFSRTYGFDRADDREPYYVY